MKTVGIFDRFRKTGGDITVEQLKQEPYEQKYFEECRMIWRNYVPEAGQSEILQGELLREIEKLREEAQGNGNRNWDGDFSCFCDFIRETLCSQPIYSAQEKMQIELIMRFLKDCGEYSERFGSGKIPDDEVDIDRIAYVGENLYDRIADAVGKMQAEHPEPIPYEKKPGIRR